MTRSGLPQEEERAFLNKLRDLDDHFLRVLGSEGQPAACALVRFLPDITSRVCAHLRATSAPDPTGQMRVTMTKGALKARFHFRTHRLLDSLTGGEAEGPDLLARWVLDYGGVRDLLPPVERFLRQGSWPLGKARLDSWLGDVLQARRAFLRARDAFAEMNLNLVNHFVKRYVNVVHHLQVEDLVQEGRMGLVRGIERFDVRRPGRFSTYAGQWIRHCVTRSIDNQEREVSMPVHRIQAAARGKFGKEGDRLFYFQTVQAVYERRFTTISAPPPGSDTPRDFLPSSDRPEERLGDLEEKALVRALVDDLEPRKADVLRARFGLDGGEERTLNEIAATLKMSRERTRQLQAAAMADIRHILQHGRSGYLVHGAKRGREDHAGELSLSAAQG